MELTRPSGVTVAFAWKSPLIEEDRDQYACAVLPEALRLALQDVERIAQINVALLELESEGLLARVGVRDGDTAWAATDKARTTPTEQRKPFLVRLWSRLRKISTSSWSRLL